MSAVRRRVWLIVPVTGAAVAVAAVVALRARRGGERPSAPADLRFMRALHAALRRDLSRLRDAATQVDLSTGAPATLLAGWDGFRAQLDNHHSAEDGDLWPVLRWQHEEGEVFPLLERHLTHAQWRTFLRKERSRRPSEQRPEFLTWILDDADDQAAAAVLAEMPPAARLAYRTVLGPRYEAQHRWQINSAAEA